MDCISAVAYAAELAVNEAAAKSVEQQDIHAVHRIRSELLGQRTAKTNQIRGLVAECGLVASQNLCQLRRALPRWLEDAENGLTERFRRLLSGLARPVSHPERHDTPDIPDPHSLHLAVATPFRRKDLADKEQRTLRKSGDSEDSISPSCEIRLAQLWSQGDRPQALGPALGTKIIGRRSFYGWTTR